MSHSSRDSIEALPLKTWPERTEPGLVGEVVADLDPDTGIPAGVQWKEALRRANDRCAAVICPMSKHWDASDECRAEYRVTSHSTRIHPLSVSTRVLGRWHAATVHFLCPREQA